MNNPALNDLDLIYYAVLKNAKAIEELRKLIETLLISNEESELP